MTVELPQPTPPAAGPNAADVADMAQLNSACRALTLFGTWGGWCLAAAGVLFEVLHLVETTDPAISGRAGWAVRGLQGRHKPCCSCWRAGLLPSFRGSPPSRSSSLAAGPPAP